jgi:hypothetical protein
MRPKRAAMAGFAPSDHATIVRLRAHEEAGIPLLQQRAQTCRWNRRARLAMPQDVRHIHPAREA